MEFLNTNVGKRMQNAARAKTLYREQPFVLGVDAKEFYPDQKKGEMVLIQGIIDAYFEEDGEIIVQGDFKQKVIDLLIKEGYTKTKGVGG